MSATDYECKKADVRNMIAYLAKWHKAASVYLRDHVVLDDATQTFRYTGDDRIRVTPTPEPVEVAAGSAEAADAATTEGAGA